MRTRSLRAGSWPPVLALALGLSLVPSPAGADPEGAACAGLERALTSLARQQAHAERAHSARRVVGGWRLRAGQILSRRYADACVRINQIQVLGTHNSYHVQPSPDVLETLLLFSSEFLAWEYTHPPLDQQFALEGVRQIELDVFADPEGGLYAERRGLIVLGQDPASGLPELDEPGLKVLHVQDLDFQTTCLTFVACLRTVKAWSDANPGHLPIMILVEVKDEAIPDPLNLGFTVPLPFDATAFRELDAEILSVFPPERVIRPDEVRGGRSTLEEGALAGNWPTLGRARGRVLFALDNLGKRLEYQDGRPSLEGRVVFTNSSPGEADAAFVKMNDPAPPGDPMLIPDLVRTGYLVRTRADGDTVEARSGDTSQRDAALASGAQFVSTDYPVPNPDFGTGYFVAIPGGVPARCNPVNGPPGCRADALERF
jgi:Phosphoinositide phospholipase C, Ca2+-dependent